MFYVKQNDPVGCLLILLLIIIFFPVIAVVLLAVLLINSVLRLCGFDRPLFFKRRMSGEKKAPGSSFFRGSSSDVPASEDVIDVEAVTEECVEEKKDM